MPHFSGHYRQLVSGFGDLAVAFERVALPLARNFIKKYWKRITCSSSTRINRYSNQEENAKRSLEKHSNKHNRKNKLELDAASPVWGENGRTQQQQQKEKRKFSFQRNELHREVAPIFSPKYEMISNLLPTEATHSSLDLLEKPPLLVTFENAFTQKIGPSHSPDGPMLEFEETRR